jgi:hypothetical protein
VIVTADPATGKAVAAKRYHFREGVL